ncbi:MAG: C39 family peptidase [Myxococcales bacterium]|nr:C39 family peptidase [Myxococcales bacterium]
MQEHLPDVLPPARSASNARERLGEAVVVPANLLRVPSVKQRTEFSCGNAATLALLRYWRWDVYEHVEEAALYEPLETSRSRGTEPGPIATYLNTVAGVSAEYRFGDVTMSDLQRAIDAGQPPIVDLQAWRDRADPWPEVWDAGHYVVLVGYDEERLFFMDPSRVAPEPYVYLPKAELDERWHDLAGERDDRVEHMVVFVRGSTIPRLPDGPLPEAVDKLG